MDYQGGSAAPTPGSGRKVKNYDEQTVTPVTICMINEASASPDGGTVTLADGRPVHHVRVVAVPREINDTSTSVHYIIEDGTGMISAKQWTDENAPNSAKTAQQETTKHMAHQYLDIVGEIKVFDGAKSIVAQSVAPLTTGNQITHHMLQVVYSAEMHQRQGQHAGLLPLQGVGFGNNNYMAAGKPIQQLSSAQGEGVKQDVLNYIRTHGDEADGGASIHACVAQLAHQYNEAQVRKTFEDLSAEGIIYSTINEDHYMYASY